MLPLVVGFLWCCQGLGGAEERDFTTSQDLGVGRPVLRFKVVAAGRCRCQRMANRRLSKARLEPPRRSAVDGAANGQTPRQYVEAGR